MSSTYVVTAPYITVDVGTLEGRKLLGFYRGATLPPDVAEHSIRHHLDRDMIREEPAATQLLQAEPGEVPSNTGSEPPLYSTDKPADTAGAKGAAKSGPGGKGSS